MNRKDIPQTSEPSEEGKFYTRFQYHEFWFGPFDSEEQANVTMVALQGNDEHFARHCYSVDCKTPKVNNQDSIVDGGFPELHKLAGNSLTIDCNNKKLKSCPFCGGAAVNTNDIGFGVKCKENDCVRMQGFAKAEYAVDAWNTRSNENTNNP